MSNEKGEVKTVTVKAGEVATARINVERAAAKLVEQSKTTAFENITPGIYGKKLNITLRQYSFVNLQQDTYVLATTTQPKLLGTTYPKILLVMCKSQPPMQIVTSHTVWKTKMQTTHVLYTKLLQHGVRKQKLLLSM